MIGTYCVVRFSNWLLNHRVGWGTRVGIVPPDSSWNLSFTICIILTSLRRAGGPVVSRVGWIVLHSISFDIWPNIGRGMGKHKGRLRYKGRSYFDLVSTVPSLRPLSLYTCSLLKQMKIFSIKLYPDPRSIIWVADNFLITQALATLCSLVSVISKSWFLDAIASPSTYPCQWVSQSVIHSFRLEIAIASPSFASLFIIGKSWLNSAQITTHPDRRKYSHLIAN